MHLFTKIGVATTAAAAAALSIALAAPATADTAAQPGDVVGVGSDTAQNLADFVFDGAPGIAGGYNSVGNVNRVVNVFATGDANGRATYDGTVSASGTPNSLPGSIVLRAGTKPVVRPNGTGGGLAALIADTNGGYQGLPKGAIQFARLSRLPNSTEIGGCPATADSPCGGLHVYQAGTDNLSIAHVKTGYNGPSGLSAQELVSIYTCQITKWSDLPGAPSNASTAVIHPLIPQSGSGTRTFFLADLQAAAGLSQPPTPGTCVRSVQEHDPTGLYGDSSPGDAIEPFSGGKISLINSGYFANGIPPSGTPTVASTAYAAGSLVTLSGAPGDGKAVYSSTRGLFFAVPQTLVTSSTPFQAGSTQNFVTALFTSTTSAIRSPVGQDLITAAGFTPQYKDCDINPTSC